MQVEIGVRSGKTQKLLQSICLVVPDVIDIGKLSTMISAVAAEALQTAIEYERAIQSIESLAAAFQETESMLAMITEAIDEFVITSAQKTKASYKHNRVIQDRRYRTQMKSARPIPHRKFFVRKLQ